MQIQANELPTIAFFGDDIDSEKFRSVSNSSWRRLKPNWGFWTSPVMDDGRSAWMVWAEEERFRVNHRAAYLQEVIPAADAKVFMVDTVDDALYIQEKYEWNWEAIANDYDAVYVTRDGVYIMRDGCWDMPSVLWFNMDAFKVKP